MFKDCSLALITFLILFAGQAAAECEHVYGNMNMIECEKNEYDKANKQLQELIQSIKSNLHPDEKQPFDDANKTWLEYRKAHCWSAASLYDTGSMGGFVEMACHANLTKQRVKQLQQDFADRLKSHATPVERNK